MELGLMIVGTGNDKLGDARIVWFLEARFGV